MTVKHGGLEASATCNGPRKPSVIPIQVLPLRFARAVVDRPDAMTLSIDGNRKTGRKTESQRTDGDDDQHTVPPPSIVPGIV